MMQLLLGHTQLLKEFSKLTRNSRSLEVYYIINPAGIQIAGKPAKLEGTANNRLYY